jgi:hypothetical protein
MLRRLDEGSMQTSGEHRARLEGAAIALDAAADNEPARILERLTDSAGSGGVAVRSASIPSP